MRRLIRYTLVLSSTLASAAYGQEPSPQYPAPPAPAPGQPFANPPSDAPRPRADTPPPPAPPLGNATAKETTTREASGGIVNTGAGNVFYYSPGAMTGGQPTAYAAPAPAVAMAPQGVSGPLSAELARRVGASLRHLRTGSCLRAPAQVVTATAPGTFATPPSAAPQQVVVRVQHEYAAPAPAASPQAPRKGLFGCLGK